MKANIDQAVREIAIKNPRSVQARECPVGWSASTALRCGRPTSRVGWKLD